MPKGLTLGLVLALLLRGNPLYFFQPCGNYGQEDPKLPKLSLKEPGCATNKFVSPLIRWPRSAPFCAPNGGLALHLGRRKAINQKEAEEERGLRKYLL